MMTERMNRNNNSISASSLSHHGGYFIPMTGSVRGSILVKVRPYLPACSQDGNATDSVTSKHAQFVWSIYAAE